jgi:hypothetical protein
MHRIVLAAFAAVSIMAVADTGYAAEWDPAKFASEDVLEFRSVNTDGEEHWSKVWLVIVDGDVYIRLGNRAAGRIEENVEAPYVGIRIAGDQFDGVLTEPKPEMAERVAEAMAAKYTTDIFVSWVEHPLTLKLIEKSDPED